MRNQDELCKTVSDLWDTRPGRNPERPTGRVWVNGFELHDVHGNVWEWVEDCSSDSYAGAPTDGSSWESGDCARRVLRGGSWDDLPRFLRSANRNWYTAGFRLDDVGFRVARTLD